MKVLITVWLYVFLLPLLTHFKFTLNYFDGQSLSSSQGKLPHIFFFLFVRTHLWSMSFVLLVSELVHSFFSLALFKPPFFHWIIQSRLVFFYWTYFILTEFFDRNLVPCNALHRNASVVLRTDNGYFCLRRRMKIVVQWLSFSRKWCFERPFQ